MVEKVVDNRNDLTVFKCSSALTEQECLEAIRSFYKESPTKFTLWQLDGFSATNISTDALRRIYETIRTLGNKRKGGKTAIVAPLDLEYGLGRMIQTWAGIGGLPYETKVFRTPEEAGQWLFSKE
ncbi:MAG: hypothetical protein JXQ30_09440 [Spirochaetes bacterium]|nr:hypothetical protein [Spirochaetota bacterium]